MERNSFARGEFMEFLDQFLDEHPDVVEDRKQAWAVCWSPPRSGQGELAEALTDPYVG